MLIALLFSSCAFPRYKHVTEANQKLDFSKGKWIVNNIESPEGTNADMTGIVLKKLDYRSITYIDSLRLFLALPYNIPFSPDSVMLDNVGVLSKYDYLINVKTGIIDDNPEGAYLKNPTGYLKRRSEATIVIYDLKFHRKVYSDNVVASIILGVDDTNFRYAKSTKRLMYSALRKSLKTLKKSTK